MENIVFLLAFLTYFSEILEKIFVNEYYLNIRIMFTLNINLLTMLFLYI